MKHVDAGFKYTVTQKDSLKVKDETKVNRQFKITNITITELRIPNYIKKSLQKLETHI